MKKLLALIISLLALSAYATNISAQEPTDNARRLFDGMIGAYYDNWALDENYKPLEGFAITSGLPAKGDNVFGFERSVKGTAPKDTAIKIIVYLYDENLSELYEAKTIELDPIGTFGFFDKTVLLEDGDNYIIIIAENGSSRALASSVIKCKDFGVKMALENNIAFPGQWTVEKPDAGDEPEQGEQNDY